MDSVGLAARARRHWLFGLVLVAALALRILTALAFRPIMWFGGDSASYLATGLRLIPDPSRVGGYGFMLWVLRPVHSFALVAGVQHLMGLAMGVLIYLLARRYGLPAWAATLATIPVLFDAYELQLEADAVPDVSFGFLVLLALYLLLRSPGERRLADASAAAFLLGVSALLWPVGLALLGVLLVALLAALLIRRAGLVTVLAALLAGALPIAAYSAWFSLHEHQFSLTRSDGVYLWSRTMSFADCAVIRPPAAERVLCPPPGHRIAASLYIWDGNSPLLTMPGGRFSARTNRLALHFALRAIAAQPGDYLAAAGHDFALSFFWDRPVHPDAGIVDRYQFADAATAWVPATLRTPGGGTVAGDQAAYNGGRQPAPTRAVRPYASWLVSYQRYVYLRGTLLGVILLAALAAMIARRRAGGAGLPWAFAVTILLVPPLIADFDLRYLVPAVPVACLAAALAFAPGPGGPAAAQVDDVGGGHRDLGARRDADQQPAVGIDADGQAGERLTAGEFGADGAADRGGHTGVFGAQAAAVRVAAGLPPGQVPALEAGQDREQQFLPVQGGRAGRAQRGGGQRAGTGGRELGWFGGHVEADADDDRVAGRLGQDARELALAGQHIAGQDIAGQDIARQDVVGPLQPGLDAGHLGDRRGDGHAGEQREPAAPGGRHRRVQQQGEGQRGVRR